LLQSISVSTTPKGELMGFSSAKRLRLEQALSRLQEVFARPALRVIVFILALVLFYWPFISRVRPWSGWHLFLFFFAAWLGVILLLVAMGLSLIARNKPRQEDDNTGGGR
jgi:uncharacterized membrane protein